MRTLVVRSFPLVFVLVVLAVFLWPRPVREPVEADPADIQLHAYLRTIDTLDRQTDGTFSATLRGVLADPRVSVQAGPFRLPAREGIDAVLATFPDRPSGIEGMHDQMLVVFMAAALQDCETDDERRRNFLVMAEKYQLLATSSRR